MVQRLYLVVGPFTQKLFFVMVGFAMDSRITVEPLIKDALRQGHWMVDLSTSDTAQGLNLREEDNLFMRDKAIHIAPEVSFVCN